jgi:hypothetical protein
MKLIIQELDAPVVQAVTPDRNLNVVAIRPHIYRHNFPNGSLKIQVLDESDSVLAESESVDIVEIGGQTPLSFAHGYLRFDVNVSLRKDTEYKFKLMSGDGYSFSEGAYCGWVNGLDLAKYPVNGTPDGHFQHPFDYEVWERKVK